MFRSLPIVLLALLLAACAAPAPGDGTPGEASAPATTAATPATGMATADPPPAPPGETRPAPRKPAPPTGGPLPADVVPDKAVELDRSCRTDADCEVKNVGNCCGYYPACVNKDSPTDPAGVQARCARDGEMSACGFPTIEGCRCINRQCKEHLQMVDGQVPPLPTPPVDR